MIIVLCGVRGSGKNTIADILVRDHGFFDEAFANPLKAMVKHAFPAFTDDDLYGPSKNREREYERYPLTSCPWCGGGILYDKYDSDGTRMKDRDGHRRCMSDPDHDWLPEFVSPRLALQTLGTEWGRRLYTNVWIDAAFERIQKERAVRDVVYTGAPAPSLPRPTSWVITDGRFFNEVRRSRELGAMVVKLTRGLTDSKDTHASEAEFRSIPDKEFDLVFNNALLTLEELPREVGYLLKRLKEKA